MSQADAVQLRSDLSWPKDLTHRVGASERLHGISVFHDFPWLDVFPDGRTQFQRGKVLAQTVIRECPDDRIPALLLTREVDQEQGFRTTNRHFVFVVNIDDSTSSPTNAAISYLASHLSVDIADLHSYARLAELGNADDLRDAMDRFLNMSDLAAWLREDTDRLDGLQQILGVDRPTDPGATISDALDTISAADTLESTHQEVLIDVLANAVSQDYLDAMMRRLTETQDGRQSAVEMVQERVDDRLRDADEALTKYETLIADDSTTETHMQGFLTRNPLIFGLQYAKITAQVGTSSGSMDFLLQRLDGYNDVVELKGPNDRLIIAVDHKAGKLPSPSTYKLSSALALALAQALAYRDRLTKYGTEATEVFGINNPRHPRLLIVIGREADMQPHSRDILLELNRTLHRAQVIGYDALAQRARVTLDNIKAYLAIEDSQIE